jgi:hypothetical protein
VETIFLLEEVDGRRRHLQCKNCSNVETSATIAIIMKCLAIQKKKFFTLKV